VNPRAIVRPTDGYSVAKARTRLRRPILLITVDRRGTLTPARPAVKSGAVDNRQHRPRTLAGSVALSRLLPATVSEHLTPADSATHGRTRIPGLALVTSAAPNWTICACADLLFPLQRETNIRRLGRIFGCYHRPLTGRAVTCYDWLTRLTLRFRSIAGTRNLAQRLRVPARPEVPDDHYCSVHCARHDPARIHRRRTARPRRVPGAPSREWRHGPRHAPIWVIGVAADARSRP